MKKRFGKYTVEISNPDKEIFPGITKLEMINYYEKISGKMLPLIRNRPLTLQRFPNGIGKQGFYQKDKSDYFPEWINSVEVPKEDGVVNQMMANNTATLVYLANQGVVTFHNWLSKKDKLLTPDRMIFDLDPPEKGKFEVVKEAARDIRKFFEEKINFTAYLMTSGSKGLHVVIPVMPHFEFEKVKDLAKSLADCLVDHYPEKYTTELRKNKRKGRVFLDWLRNSRAQTAVAPYSIRPKEEAPVACPIHWEELDDKDLTSKKYTVKNLFKKIETREDPWKNINRRQNNLKKNEKKILKLTST